MAETELCDWIELTLESNLRAELSPPPRSYGDQCRPLAAAGISPSIHFDAHAARAQFGWLDSAPKVLALITPHRLAWHSPYVFKNNKFIKQIWKHSSCHLHLHSYTYLLFCFYKPFHCHFQRGWFLFFFKKKSVKVQRGVTTSKNPSVITIKHNDNGTVITVATVE